MAFKLPNGFKSVKEKFAENTRPEIQALIDSGKKISFEEFSQMRMNSWELNQVIKLLDNEALIKHTEYCISQCKEERFPLPAHYNDAVIHHLAPLLISRLKENSEKIASPRKWLTRSLGFRARSFLCKARSKMAGRGLFLVPSMPFCLYLPPKRRLNASRSE